MASRLRRIVPLLGAIIAATATSQGVGQDPVNPLRQGPSSKPASSPRGERPAVVAPRTSEKPEKAQAEAAGAVQVQETDAASPKSGPGSIYALTKTAKSVEDYSKIIALCQQARQSGVQSDEEAYLRQLVGWAFNRRGEAWIAKAATSGDEEREDADRRALADFEASIQADPNRWKAVHNRGVSRAVEGQLEAALADFARVIQLQPQYDNAWFNRAEVLYELGRYDQAASDYAAALERRPDDRAARTGLAHCRFRIGRLQEAISDYSAVVAAAPGDLDALINRAEAYQAAGQWEQAALDYRESLHSPDRTPRALASAAWFMATCPEARFRAPQKALELSQQALASAESPTARLLDTVAAARANSGDFEGARSAIAEAVSLAPQDPALGDRQALYSQDRPFRQPSAAIGLASANDPR